MKKLFLLFKEVIEHVLYGVVFGWCWSYSGDKSGYLTSWDLHEARQTIKKLTHWVLDVLSIQSRLTLCDPRDCSPPGSSVHGIIQARILEWVAIFFSRGSSWRREQTCVSCIGRWILYQWATWEVSLSLSLFIYVCVCVCVCVCVFQFSSITQSCPTLYNPMDCDTPGFPVQLQHPELAQTHVHQVGDAIQPFHPLLSPSPPPFTSGDQSIGASALASALPMHVQHWFPLGLTSLISLQSKGLFSSTTPQKHQLFSAQLSLWSNSHIHTWLLEKP